ncbi:MAG: thiamine phosphate synthase [Cellvibrionaceae bacterium]
MSYRPLVLNFSANDSAGLAGMAMDIRSQSAMGVHSASVVTANTAQNNERVISVNVVDDAVFDDQLAAVSVLDIQAIKVGLLGSAFQCKKIAAFLEKKREEHAAENCSLILDPVLGSSSGASFSSDNTVQAIKEVLLPLVTLLTPNIPELERLTGVSIQSREDIESAASQLLASGLNAVLIKGGHFEPLNNEGVALDSVEDYFSDGQRSFWLSNKKVVTNNTRGTGCALSSAIASSLALGYSLYDAVVIGKMAISQGLRQAYSVADCAKHNQKEYGPVNVGQFPDQQVDLPSLTRHPYSNLHPFPECNQPVLGLYPVVDRAQWIERLALSVPELSTIQLRSKELPDDQLENEIIEAIRLAKKHQVRLFINDYWQLAIKHKAYGVHLGQEDLDDADIQAIQKAGLRLGISTHCHYEVARAHAYQPSYIACGPVYHTTTKDMPWVPHGLTGLSYWRKVLRYPLVAIGGINQSRFDAIAATGVDSVAMITAITLADDPMAVTKDFIERFDKQHKKVKSKQDEKKGR